MANKLYKRLVSENKWIRLSGNHRKRAVEREKKKVSKQFRKMEKEEVLHGNLPIRDSAIR